MKSIILRYLEQRGWVMDSGLFEIWGVGVGLAELLTFLAIPAGLVAAYHIAAKGHLRKDIDDKLADGKARVKLRQRLIAQKSIKWHKNYINRIEHLDARLELYFGGSINTASHLLSYTAFNRCLSLALLYPLLFVLIAWVFGADGTIGSVDLLPPADSNYSRIVILAGIFAFLFFYFGSFDMQTKFFMNQ